MKNKVLIPFIVLFTMVYSLTAQTVDISASTLKWTGKKITGEHYGMIDLKSASMKVEGNKIVSGTYVIDMNSINCEDIEDAENNSNLIAHLKSDDFFGTEKYPEAKLVITKSSVFENGKATVTGNLTIKGKTNPITFKVQKTAKGYFATIIVDRAKYDIKYGSGSFFDNLGDNIIYDEFTLEVALVVK